MAGLASPPGNDFLRLTSCLSVSLPKLQRLYRIQFRRLLCSQHMTISMICLYSERFCRQGRPMLGCLAAVAAALRSKSSCEKEAWLRPCWIEFMFQPDSILELKRQLKL